LNDFVGICPKCNKKIVKTKRGYSCENKDGCGFHLNYHNLAGLGVPFVKKSIIKRLLKFPDDVVELKARESGKSYKKKAWLHKGEEYTAWTIVVADDFHNEFIGICPSCGGSVLEYSSIYACSSESCSFKIWKNYKNAEISPDMAIGLLNKKSFQIECVSQNKKYKWNEEIWLDGEFLNGEKI